jgi:nucleotide-binding universal stress UspA family protein
MKSDRIERILCPIDFSEFSARAYAYASSLAHHYSAKLFVQYVVEQWQHPSLNFAVSADVYERYCTELLVQGTEQLQKFLHCHKKHGVEPRCIASQGTAADSILSFAKEQAIDLIVIGAHVIHGFERLMLGSVTERVLRMAECPVLAVPELPAETVTLATEQGDVKLDKIIACADFSDSSLSAFEYAISVAQEYDANLILVHVSQSDSKSGFADDPADKCRRMDKLVTTQSKPASKITTLVKVGRAYQEISQLARDSGADLVIMHVHGRNSIDDAIFGSTTYRVVQLGVCPVLAIHTEAPA